MHITICIHIYVDVCIYISFRGIVSEREFSFIPPVVLNDSQV
jgi:hypothetical protein